MSDSVLVLNLVALVARSNLVVLVTVLGNAVLSGRVAIIRGVGLGARDVDTDVKVLQQVGAIYIVR